MIAEIQSLDIDTLMPMPPSLARLAHIMGDPKTDASQISRVIELDQAMTVNVLKTANSVWARSRFQIGSVKEAVVRLGMGKILQMTVGSHVAPQMSQPCEAYDLEEYELWKHSVAAALAAEHMEKHSKTSVPSYAFTAALLHDIGKLLLNRYLDAEALAKIDKAVEEKDMAYLEAEELVLGTDHAKVGGIIAVKWQFPEDLVTAIELHHDPDARPSPLMDVVHVANAVAKLIGVGLGSEQMNMKVSEEAPKRLGMSSSGLEALCVDAKNELAKVEDLFVSEKDGS
ncbi:MAG: HDOD domain-containing protein [Planctomycetota bacterium]|jgi:putative nucleotidyltransferase with HDIG domain